MATQQIGTTGVDKILLEYYLDPLREAFNKSTILLSRMRRKKVRAVGGRYYRYPLLTARNEAAGPRAEGGALPTPDKVTYDAAQFYRTAIYARFRISGWLINAADRRDEAVVDALDREMRGVKDTLADRANIYMFGGGTGAVARVVSDSTTSITVKTTYPWSGTKYLRAGQSVFITAVNGTSGYAGTIASITSESVFVTTADISAQVEPNDLVFLDEGDGSTSSLSRGAAMFGLLAGVNHVDPSWLEYRAAPTGTTYPAGGDFATGEAGKYGRIARGGAAGDPPTAGATSSFWNGNVIDIANGPVKLSDLFKAQHDADIAGGGRVSLILTNYALWRQYGVATGWRSSSGTGGASGITKTFDGTSGKGPGPLPLDFAGVPMLADKYCPKGCMFFLDESTWDILEEAPVNFMDRDGAVLERVADKDEYQATLIWQAQFVTGAPNRNSVLIRCNETMPFDLSR